MLSCSWQSQAYGLWRFETLRREAIHLLDLLVTVFGGAGETSRRRLPEDERALRVLLRGAVGAACASERLPPSGLSLTQGHPIGRPALPRRAESKRLATPDPGTY